MLKEYGGVYMDVDFNIEEWDVNAHHYLDFYSYPDQVLGDYWHLSNDFIFANP